MSVSVNVQSFNMVKVRHYKDFSTVGLVYEGFVADVDLFFHGSCNKQAAVLVGRIIAECEDCKLELDKEPAPEQPKSLNAVLAGTAEHFIAAQQPQPLPETATDSVDDEPALKAALEVPNPRMSVAEGEERYGTERYEVSQRD